MINKRLIPVLIILYIIGMVFGTIFDLRIDQILYSQNNLFADIFEVMGEPPAMIFTSINLAILSVWCIYHKKKVQYVLCILGGFISYGYAIGNVMRQYTGSWQWLITIPTAVIINVATFVLMRNMKEETANRHFRTALACVEAALVVLAVITLLKQLFRRVRYFQMVDTDSEFKSFTDWYVINIFDPTHTSKNTSFPSGHLANASVMFMTSLYFPKQKKWLQPLLFLFIIAAMFARMIYGAHFLTDVLTGAAITLLVGEIAAKINKVDIWETPVVTE